MFICVKDRFNFRNGKSCGDICRADVRRSPPLPRAEGGAAAVGHESRRDFFEPSLAGFPFFTIFTYAKSSNVPKLRIIVGCMAGFCLLAAGLRVRAQPPHGVAFYDADCLYDTVPSPFGNDTRYLPQGEMRWTGERYRRKVMQTAAVIDSLGLPLVGLYGVENESVVRDVAAACKGDYAYLFRTTDSYNGLDFALFYFGDRFFPDRVEAGHFWMTAAGELRGAGRVCLLMSASDRYIGYKIEEHRRQHPDERLLVAGRTAGAEPQRCGRSEPLAAARRAGRGTRRAGNRWEMRSNVLIDTAFRVVRGDVYARRWLFDPSGEAPWATYTRRRYEGGPGANLPVFCYFR